MRHFAGWMAVALALCAAPVLAQEKVIAPKGYPGQWFGIGSYAPKAMHLGREARIVVSLSMDTSGKITECKIVVTSGSAPLDKDGCDIALTSIHLSRVPDKNFTSTVPSTFTLPIRWVLPTPVSIPFASFYWGLGVELAADKKPLSCSLKRGSQALALKDTHCPSSKTDPDIPDVMLGPLLGKHVFTYQTIAFTRDGDKPFQFAPPEPNHYVSVFRRAHAVLASNGSVAKCQMIEDINPIGGPDICTLLDMFGPLEHGDHMVRAGTIVMSFAVDPADDPK